nr:glutathione binding-like protein [Defluviimonas salinarum]
MLFLADTVYPSYNRYYHPDRYTASADGKDAVKAQALTTAVSQLEIVERRLADHGPWLLGERFSACDIYLQMMTTWHDPPQALFAAMPKLRALARGVTERPGCQWAIRKHNFSVGIED